MKASSEKIRPNTSQLPQEGRLADLDAKRKLRDRLLRMIIQNELTRKRHTGSEECEK